MNNLMGTKTDQNLRFAFSGESEARNKYTFFAAAAKKEGYEQIAAIFTETADNERAHAKLWFDALSGMGQTTAENLQIAANGEHYEWSEMYSQFAKEARDEGFSDIATQFEQVAKIEKEHEERFLQLLANIESNHVFEKDTPVTWICRNCGHTFTGTTAPEICPVCKHVKAYFQEKAENY